MDAQATLPRLVYQHARARPDAVALTSIGQGSVSWAGLWETSRRWGGWLEGGGVTAGDRVVALMPQSLEASYLWMGCCAIGAVEVAINCEFRGEWLRNALRSAQAKAVVLPARFLERLLPVFEGCGIATVFVYDLPAAGLDLPAGISVVSSLPANSPLAGGDGEPDTRPQDIACILYTSGTTGQSKAVQIPWAQLHMTYFTGTWYLGPGPQVYYLPYAPCHMSGRGALYRAALTGGRAVVREVFSTSAFWDDIREHGCTWTLLFATPMRFLAGLPERPDDADNSLELVQMCPLLPEADALKRRFGFRGYAVYGQTEMGNPFVVPMEDSISANAGCCGRAIPGVEARLVDEHDYPVPRGSTGELAVRSDEPWLFNCGYLGAPDATVKVWRNGWLHSGDLFREDEKGNYYYVDRTKDMIRRRGENISSVELEGAVLSHPAVAEAAAVGVASPLGDEEVLLAVVPRAGSRVDPAELVAYLRGIVPRFAVPRYVRLVEALPKTPATLRVQKQALRAEGISADTWDGAGGGRRASD